MPAHFVGVPATTSSRPLTSLSLNDKSGNAAIAVADAHMDWTIELCARNDANTKIASLRFQSRPYKKEANKFVYFMLRGLGGGDSIAAYDAAGKAQTLPLLIASAATDRPSNNLPARRSNHVSKFILNPAGAEQSDVPISGQGWIDTCENVIKYMMTKNRLAEIIVSTLPDDTNIFPFLSGATNATAGVQFAPQNFAHSVAPGGRPDEVLFHELCHIADDHFNGYADLLDLDSHIMFFYDRAEFFSINVTNIYASMRGRPLRKDHRSFGPMPRKFQDVSQFKLLAGPNRTLVRTNKPALYAKIAALRAAWNPF